MSNQVNNWHFYQWINSCVDGIHGYKGPYPSRKTVIRYYIFTMYAFDKSCVIDTTNNSKGGGIELN